ncbi:MAG TPA: transglycosylase SLT domain-containing protein [Aliidongia sp.]|nr:transglycosylase SLT domain-containing protein [Aliidongia sp.]
MRPPAVPSVDPAIVTDIRRASRSANVDFGYMMAQAAQESSFQPDAKASTSSATGLFQFIDSTWLTAVKQYGSKYGLDQYAQQISVGSDGRAHVADPAVKQQILDLRKDPKVSSEIAAEFAHANKTEVERALGRPANSTDLYLAHFLGAQGATDFVKQITHDGSAKAAEILPQAAAANKSVFYDSNGDAKTVAQIYRSFSDKIERQISQYASATGADADVSAEKVAIHDESSVTGVNTTDGNTLASMNILTLAALKLISEGPTGHPDPTDQQQQAQPSDRHRPTDTNV